MRLINGPEAFTPDGEFILGPTDVRGFWVAAGFCAHGLAGAGGMGKLVAEWIVEGRASTSGTWTPAASAPPTRAGNTRSRANDRGLLDLLRRQVPRARAGGGPAAAALAGLPAPAGARRRLRRGEVRLGAGELVRAERRRRRREPAPARLGRPPLVAGDRRGAPRLPRGGGALRRVLVREDRGLRAGRGRAARVALRQPRRPRRRRDHLHADAERQGGIECDFTVTRLAEDRFRIVTGTAFGRHDLAWIRQHAPEDGSVRVDDVTSPYACIGIWGPASREILAR